MKTNIYSVLLDLVLQFGSRHLATQATPPPAANAPKQQTPPPAPPQKVSHVLEHRTLHQVCSSFRLNSVI